MSDLKPCPFCGCNRIGMECGDGGPALRKLTYNARCNNCMASCAGYGTRELAVNNWNTRHESAKASEQPVGITEKPDDLQWHAFFEGYYYGQQQICDGAIAAFEHKYKREPFKNVPVRESLQQQLKMSFEVLADRCQKCGDNLLKGKRGIYCGGWGCEYERA